MRIPYISLLAAGALSLGGCAYDGLGMGLGYGSDPYYGAYGYGSPYGGYGYGSPYYGGYGGHSGISIGVGYGSGYGGYGYGSPYYGGYGGYGSPYYGWYDNFYYPGTGYYVYDTYRRPHAMSTTQRQYWASRSPALRSSSSTTTTNAKTRTAVRPNWSGFNRHSTSTTRHATSEAAREAREDRRDRHNQ